MESKILTSWKDKWIEAIVPKCDDSWNIAKLVDFDESGVYLDTSRLSELGEDFDTMIDTSFYWWKDIDRIRLYVPEEEDSLNK